jgi:hypothetical protein
MRHHVCKVILDLLMADSVYPLWLTLSLCIQSAGM